jgi:hypothetical protein
MDTVHNPRLPLVFAASRSKDVVFFGSLFEEVDELLTEVIGLLCKEELLCVETDFVENGLLGLTEIEFDGGRLVISLFCEEEILLI